jgi:SAM-dependent methyltransferase
MPKTDSSCDATLAEQREYYRARAAEYDAWWLRQGRYDRGAKPNAVWFDEGAAVARALAEFKPGGDVLELACGTGIWTEKLLPTARSVTAVDASPEMLALNAHRVGKSRVQHVQADLFHWRPDRTYDVVFFGFWLSHVPPELFDAFWQRVAAALNENGRVFFVDSRREPSSTAHDHRLPGPGEVTHLRRLDDGREFRIFKIFYDRADLTARLAGLGWQFQVHETPTYFLHGCGGRPASQVTR